MLYTVVFSDAEGVVLTSQGCHAQLSLCIALGLYLKRHGFWHSFGLPFLRNHGWFEWDY